MFSRPGKDARLYARIFFAITLCIVITMLLLSGVLYFNFENIIKNQVYIHNRDSLAQTGLEASIMTETAKKLACQIFLDLNISKLLYYSPTDVYDIGPAVMQLGNYQVSMPFIESVYVYNGKTESFYIRSDTGRIGEQHISVFDDRDMAGIIRDYREYMPFEPIPRHYRLESGRQNGEYSCYTYMYYDLLASSERLECAVVVNISESWLSSVIVASNKSMDSDTYVLDRRGTLISGSKHYTMLTDLAGKDYVRTILGNPSSGNFTDEVEGVKSLITYTAPDAMGWRYVRITPYQVVFDEIERMRRITILLIFVILSLGLAMAFVLSRRLYIPVARALKALEIKKRTDLKVLRREYLRNLLLSNEHHDTACIQKRFDELEIGLSTADKILLALFKIDDYGEFSRKYSLEDRELLKFGIMNIAQELASEGFSTETLDMGEDHIVLFLSARSENSDLPETSLPELIKRIQTAVSTHLKISLSAALSPEDGSVEDLSLLYRQTVEASYHRLFYGHGCTLSSKEILQYKTKEYFYPSKKEKAMVDALMAGKTEDAKKLFTEIIIETACFPFTVVNFVISHLAFTISNAINIIQKNNSLAGHLDFRLSAVSVSNFETLEEIKRLFFQLFEDIRERLEEKRSARHEQLILKIKQIIEQEYMSPDLCLNNIAESLAMHPVYIGRLFRQHTLKTVLDYITEVRMKHAERLLLETDYSVAEISGRVGFSNSSYFYRTFKKECGVTPNAFRKNV